MTDNVTEIGKLFLSRMMRADRLNNLYNSWFQEVLSAWYNAEAHDVSLEEMKHRVRYIINHVGREAQQRFMQDMVTAIEKLMSDINTDKE